jgi:nitronate monooxygenase
MTLPLGVGFITSLCKPADFIQNFLPVISEHRVAAIWLFAPPNRECHAEIIPALKAAGKAWGLKVFVQIGSVQSAREAVEDGADVLVVQGTDAGGHQWARGSGLISFLPEITDMLADEFSGSQVQVIGAGGIMDGRGIAAAMVLGKAYLNPKVYFADADERRKWNRDGDQSMCILSQAEVSHADRNSLLSLRSAQQLTM